MQDPESVRKIEDPLERAKVASALVTEAQSLASEYALITREAFREMRLTMSLNQISKEMDISRTRVRQLGGPDPKAMH